MICLLVIGLLLTTNLHQSEAHIGVCYGLLGNNLPPPQEVVALMTQYNIHRIRLYDPNQDTLMALRGGNIELMLGIPNIDLQTIAFSQENADSWVQRYVKNYLPDINFRYIVIGNEITNINDNARFSPFLLIAMENIQRAITNSGLMGRVKVSSSFDFSILGDSFPPSRSSFRVETLDQFLDPILRFLASNGAPLLINMYPFFSYITNIKDVRLDYALFTAPNNVVIDGEFGYQNMFDAMLDSVYSALENAGYESIEVVVSETGWPSSGNESTSVENERIYNTNLIQHVKNGTPRRPNKPTETYLFAMFDENLKGPPEIEKYWGLFHPNKQMKFPLEFN